MFVFLGQAIWIGLGESVGVCPGVLQRGVFCQGQLDKIAALCLSPAVRGSGCDVVYAAIPGSQCQLRVEGAPLRDVFLKEAPCPQNGHMLN